jgi:hypothetical protein
MDLLQKLEEISMRIEDSAPILKVIKVTSEPQLSVDKEKQVSEMNTLNTKNVPQSVVAFIKKFESENHVRLDYDKPEVESVDGGLNSVKIKATPQIFDGPEYYYNFVVDNVSMRDAVDIKKAILIYYMRNHRS